MERISELVTLLCSEDGVSGAESAVVEKAQQLLSPFGECRRDALGSLLCFVSEPSQGADHILMDAHIDEIGMMVMEVGEGGFLKVTAVGGMDVRVLASAEVWVHTRKEKLYGVLISTPPHLGKGKDEKKALSLDEFWVDLGLPKEEVVEKVRPGDWVTMIGSPIAIADGRLVSKALDDRAGCAVIIRALELLEGKNLSPLGLTVSFTSREETGGQGAKVVAYQINPTLAIVVDGTPSDPAFCKKPGQGAIGDGVAIGVAPTLDRALSREMEELAQKEKIPVTLEVMGGRTGTNADDIAVSNAGVPAVTLSFPQQYAHTAIEMVDCADLENTARLLAAFLLKRAKEAFDGTVA